MLFHARYGSPISQVAFWRRARVRLEWKLFDKVMQGLCC